MTCHCTIVPNDVLEALAKDSSLPADSRQSFADTAALEAYWRKARLANANAANAASFAAGAATLAYPPVVIIHNCNHTQTLPGAPVSNPGSSADATAKRTFAETTAMAKFLHDVFGRNSLDNNGMTLQSSIHYGVKYNNAFWNGNQMTYGDGDGNIFVDFTKGNDVIAHELTHGITQFTTHLAYTNQAGGLNESCSDIFGSMFRQWRANQTAAQGDWLIGKDIMGPSALAIGKTCLRDMAAPKANHCLAPQIDHFNQYANGQDPHVTSGVPNLAFCRAAKAIGGKSWEKAGKIWYAVMTGYAAQPNMKMKTFANRTRIKAVSLFPGQPAVLSAVNNAWLSVGL
jgi:Zn-dependent metalloprotease